MKLRQCLIVFAATLATNFVIVSKSYAQRFVVNGSKISFNLPLRPVGTKEAYDEFLLFRKLVPNSGPLILRTSEAENYCPEITKIFERIYNRIVERNGLRDFINNGPGMELLIQCFDLNEVSPRSIGTNAIVMTGSTIGAVDTEDEIAFIMAHEIGHVLLGHLEYGIDLIHQERLMTEPERKRFEKANTEKFEPEADKIGALLVWNAGYSPYALSTAFDKLSISSKGLVISFVSQYFFDDGHGSIKSRVNKVEPILKLTSADSKIPPTIPPNLEAAKAEYWRLN